MPEGPAFPPVIRHLEDRLVNPSYLSACISGFRIFHCFCRTCHCFACIHSLFLFLRRKSNSHCSWFCSCKKMVPDSELHPAFCGSDSSFFSRGPGLRSGQCVLMDEILMRFPALVFLARGEASRRGQSLEFEQRQSQVNLHPCFPTTNTLSRGILFWLRKKSDFLGSMAAQNSVARPQLRSVRGPGYAVPDIIRTRSLCVESG